MEAAVPHSDSIEEFTPYRKKIALVVGIDQYPAQIPELQYAVQDAKALRSLLTDDLGFDEVHLLLDQEANRESILRSLSDLKQTMEPEDQFLFFFAGHGISFGRGESGVGYLVPQDADGVDEPSLAAKGIPMDDVAQRLRRLPAKHVLMIVDSCFSGFAASRSRGLSPKTARYLSNITNRPARQLLTAGKRDEEAREGPEWGHSAFTYQFLKGFRTREADADGNGVIIVTELHAYLSSAVSEITEGRQNPQFTDLGNGEGEFAFLLPSSPTPPPVQGLLQSPPARKGRPVERLVTAVQRDATGELAALCDENATWSPRSKKDIVADIESGKVRYYVDWGKGQRTLIQMVAGPRGNYLRTKPDRTERNNLSSLRDCP